MPLLKWNNPSGNATLRQGCSNVDASWRCIGVTATLHARHVPAGIPIDTERRNLITATSQLRRNDVIKKWYHATLIRRDCAVTCSQGYWPWIRIVDCLLCLYGRQLSWLFFILLYAKPPLKRGLLPRGANSFRFITKTRLFKYIENFST